jgi:hypothetical protein
MGAILDLGFYNSSVNNQKTTKELNTAYWLLSFDKCPLNHQIENLIVNISVEALCKIR